MRKLSPLELKKGQWTPDEDRKLLDYIVKYGHGGWRALPAKAGLRRCGKSCRLRWTNYLNPDIKRGQFNLQEQQTIIQLHALIGNRWSVIAAHLPKRTDNEIKNYWNTYLKKKLTKMGIDHVTHKPITGSVCPSQLKIAANISHMAQWESARLEAEARFARKSFFKVLDPLQTQLSSTFLLAEKSLTLTPPPPHPNILVPPIKAISTPKSEFFYSIEELSNNVGKLNDLVHVKQTMGIFYQENENRDSVGNDLEWEGLSEIFLNKRNNISRGLEENKNCWDGIFNSSDNIPF